MNARYYNGDDDRDTLGRYAGGDPEPEIATPSQGWCHGCIYDEDDPRLTPATTTRHVPVGNYELCQPMCPECAEAHDNACERQGLARYEG
jgi:hypothetical protein